jgi:pimeloyl-ACP methyl ester carboxylesterase
MLSAHNNYDLAGFFTRIRTMARPKNKKTNKVAAVGRSVFILFTLYFYAGLFIGAAWLILFSGGHTERGQLIPGQTASELGFSHSLDLRVAAKNSYPSDSLAVTQNLGTNGSITKKIFSFKVPPDGLTEYGLMLLPAAKAPVGGFPTVILCHGYESAATYSTTRDNISDMVFYAEHGFAVIKPDYRGLGLSANQGQTDSAYYSMAYNTDIMSLISAVKKTSYLDKNNINLWGHSMGAYIAFRAAVLAPAIKNLIILAGPVASLKTMYLTYIPPSDVSNLNALKTRNNAFTKYGTPFENPLFWKAASPITYIKQIKAHIQIHVGSLDQVVPPQLSADLDTALNNAHIKHDYYIYPDGAHSLAPQRNLIWQRSLQALQASGNNPPASI